MNRFTASLALAAMLGLAATGQAAPVKPAALADLGVPAINLDDAMALLPFASVLGNADRAALDVRCGAAILDPQRYGADAAAYCRNFALAETIAPTTPSEAEN